MGNEEQKPQMLPWGKPCLGMGILTWAYPHLDSRESILKRDYLFSICQLVQHNFVATSFHSIEEQPLQQDKEKSSALVTKGLSQDTAFLEKLLVWTCSTRDIRAVTVDLPLRKPWYELAKRLFPSKRVFAKPSTDCAVLQQNVKNYNNKTGT